MTTAATGTTAAAWARGVTGSSVANGSGGGSVGDADLLRESDGSGDPGTAQRRAQHRAAQGDGGGFPQLGEADQHGVRRGLGRAG